MSENRKLSLADGENLCVVCCKNVDIYSVGHCNHYVCFECSTRMRVLCDQNECPICRAQMPKVIFTRDIRDFAQLFAEFQHAQYQDRKYGLIFCSESIRRAYLHLLENRCQLCTDSNAESGANRRCTFYTFQQLKDHMRREHGLMYCDLCVDNLKIFAHERRCYTKQELGQHRRNGDKDNTSHRGHPLCEFCETRFMDSDELFRHLRRQHLFCHFCDADGKHQYYNQIEDLRVHFRDEHFLCEQGECVNMPMIAVFRSKIDLQAHIATEHAKNLSKSANKQARTLELEFTLAPRANIAERHKRQAAMAAAAAGGLRQSVYSDEEGAVGYDEPGGGPGGGSAKEINFQDDFPALGNNPGVRPTSMTTVNFTSKVNRFTGNDFPTLGGGRGAVTITTTNSRGAKKPAEVTITRTMRGGSNAQNLTKTVENFPCLGAPPAANSSTVHLSVNGNSNSQLVSPKVSIHVNHNGAITTTHITTSSSSTASTPSEAFPALGGGASNAKKQQPQWVVQQKTRQKQEPKASKVAPAPVLPSGNDLSQFPTLSSKSASKLKDVKKSSVTVPVVSNNWINNNNNVNNNNNSKSTIASTSSKLLTDDAKAKNRKNKKKNANIAANEAVAAGDSNGVVKKRSELKIGELATTSSSSKTPPGLSLPKPPPGFSTQEFPVLGNQTDLTFTSSSGQSYTIPPNSNNYYPPPNFSHRNQNLIKKCMDRLDHDGELIKDFKNYSTSFRNGSISAKEYHAYCKLILGNYFTELFPELLVLLPDVAKQQELYQECDETSTRKNLVVCEKCRQIVFKRELAEHYTEHSLESQFPRLASGGVSTTNVWKKS